MTAADMETTLARIGMLSWGMGKDGYGRQAGEGRPLSDLRAFYKRTRVDGEYIWMDSGYVWLRMAIRMYVECT